MRFSRQLFLCPLALLASLAATSQVDAATSPKPTSVYKMVIFNGLWKSFQLTHLENKFLLNAGLDFNWMKSKQFSGLNSNYNLRITGRSKMVSYGASFLYTTLKINDVSSDDHMNGVYGALANLNVIPFSGFKTGLYAGFSMASGKPSFYQTSDTEDEIKLTSFPILTGLLVNYDYEFQFPKVKLYGLVQSRFVADFAFETTIHSLAAGEKRAYNLLHRSQVGITFSLHSKQLFKTIDFSIGFPLEGGITVYSDYKGEDFFYRLQGSVGTELKLTALNLYVVSLGYRFDFGKFYHRHHFSVNLVLKL